jgi:hypothetical protein
MKLKQRIAALAALGRHMAEGGPDWSEACTRASEANAWFIPPFVGRAAGHIASQHLDERLLTGFAESHGLTDDPAHPHTVGLVMAGNIPMVGMHDLLCVFLSGQKQMVKTSSKDRILMEHVIGWLHGHHPETTGYVRTAELLKGCDAYIATGSDNTARHFEQYFGRHPHIIRRNKTSVAVLDGTETAEELDGLSDDIQTYFGLGCRNVSQLLVPEGYEFVPLLEALRKYGFFLDSHKYHHNYDYNLAIQIMNNRFYMTNGSILLTENESPFSPIGQLHYRHYAQGDNLSVMVDPEKVQCLVGHGQVPFGKAQQPTLGDFADGVDTLEFLKDPRGFMNKA